MSAPAGRSAASLVPRGVHSHTTLETTDIDKALALYRDVLGLSTAQQVPKAGLMHATNGHIAAIIQMPKICAQPYWNYYARAVPRELVDGLHKRISGLREQYELREVTDPEVERRYGIGTYGFAFADRDGNWWRIEEQDGPFGRAKLPDVAGTSVVPPGPIPYVTLESADIEKTEALYRDVLGLHVGSVDGALHVREAEGVNAIVVPVEDVVPQPVLNHHGLTLAEGDRAGVDRANEYLRANADAWGLRKVQQATEQHGSYAFYFQDADTNWWEIETLENGFNPWQRVNHPQGDPNLLNPDFGSNTIRNPF
jgi:catechol 2,3-dioxygenase-like lactoylglutathione lyase family enzyme